MNNLRRVSWACVWVLALLLIDGASSGQSGLADDGCLGVQNTPKMTIVYGTATLNGSPAPVGTLIQAFSPRGTVVGCFEVTDAGYYGTMPVYGEDSSVSPTVPGMRAGETIAFKIGGADPTPAPTQTWADDWKTISGHQVALAVTALIPDKPTAVAPANSSIVGNPRPTFDWNPANNATGYQIQVASTDVFSPTLIDTTTSATDYTPASDLSDGAYYWHVRGHNSTSGLDGPWSDDNSGNAWSLSIDTAGPAISNVQESDDPINRQGCSAPITVTIRADAVDTPAGVASAGLWYQLGAAPGTQVGMALVAGHYQKTIGPFAQAATLSYHVVATDTVGNRSQSPDGTVTVLACPVALADVVLAGPAAGFLNAPQAFTAAVSPADATLPITYTWEAVGQTITHTAGLSDTAAFAWSIAGAQAITVTADNGSGAPVSATQTITITGYEQRVNCGGVAYTDKAGRPWAGDRNYRGGAWGLVGGAKKCTASPIAGTEDDLLYQCERYWTASALPGYRFTVPNGGYEVTLKFAETAKTAAAQRKFNVKIEGVQVLTNFDIFAIAKAKNTAAPDQTFIVNVVDGELTIDFVKVLDNPKVNAIQVRQLTAYEVRVNSCGPQYTDPAGKVWQADRAWKPGQWGYVGGLCRTTTSPIARTVDDPLYQSDRTWSTGGAPGYRFSVPNGHYEVTLKFAETVFTAARKRKFSVKLEGTTVLSNYDIFGAAGAKNRAAPDQVFIVNVTDGELRLDFVRGVDMPKLNAIQVKWLNP